MVEPSTVTVAEDEKAPPAPQGTAPQADGDDAPPLVEEELLVEDVSIDGMCGVY